jgi:hypothetical protein
VTPFESRVETVYIECRPAVVKSLGRLGEDAAQDAVVKFLENPEIFSTKSPLDLVKYFWGFCKQRVSDLKRSDAARKTREHKWWNMTHKTGEVCISIVRGEKVVINVSPDIAPAVILKIDLERNPPTKPKRKRTSKRKAQPVSA